MRRTIYQALGLKPVSVWDPPTSKVTMVPKSPSKPHKKEPTVPMHWQRPGKVLYWN